MLFFERHSLVNLMPYPSPNALLHRDHCSILHINIYQQEFNNGEKYNKRFFYCTEKKKPIKYRKSTKGKEAKKMCHPRFFSYFGWCVKIQYTDSNDNTPYQIACIRIARKKKARYQIQTGHPKSNNFFWFLFRDDFFFFIVLMPQFCSTRILLTVAKIFQKISADRICGLR